MSCDKCHQKKCQCGSSSANSAASTHAAVSQIQAQVQVLSNVVKALLYGHPTWVIEDADDIASFDFATGKGSGTWENWAVCDGQSHTSSQKKVVTTPNYTDRFLVAAGGAYALGNTGGLASVTLITSQLPAHNHPVTDPGHGHTVTDPAHSHGASSGPHTHTGSSLPHTHVADPVGDHTHSVTGVEYYNYVSGAAGPSVAQLSGGTNVPVTVGPAGAHTHPLSNTTVAVQISSDSVGVVVAASNTGVTIQTSNTGVTIGNNGSGASHENRPPYFAVVFVKYIG